MGVVLAGGKGRRFGGTDKSFLALGGRPLLAHVVGRIAPQVAELLISTDSMDSRYDAFGLELCRDNPPSLPATGPLVGMASVFEALAKRGNRGASVLSVPVDTPFLPSDLVVRLSNALAAPDTVVAYAATEERDHPIVALWGPLSRDLVRELLDRRPSISLHALMTALDAVRVLFAHDRYDPFFNINRPQDLETAERIARSTDAC